MAREHGWDLVFLAQEYAKTISASVAKQGVVSGDVEEVRDSSHNATHTMAEGQGVADVADDDGSKKLLWSGKLIGLLTKMRRSKP